MRSNPDFAVTVTVHDSGTGDSYPTAMADKTLDQLKLSFALWIRDAVRLVIKQFYGHVSNYFKRPKIAYAA